ncbi:hypothetical protein SKAU_G00406020 [Synaphobranchus kaupii]|uniref:Choline/carnitine acyltransferase domain-containing protein n=1 Tax=Synaphobranchus kaupii TaxID=118154 RepID=A0A9Q1IAU8_SYNKA|nr:hypothetical protein SKAU_G00406020 [Synaphobranchus kaupii]
MLLKKISSAKYGARLFQVVFMFRQGARSLSVPAQPVPPLAQTLQGYLRALEPLLPADELEHTREVVRKFGAEGGLGEKLQRGLEKRARHSHNWISDWWVKWACLENRQPLAVHSNPAIALPKQDYSDWRGQLLFASKLIAGVLDFKAKIDSGCLPVEHMRGQPLCSDLFPLLFSSCRIPGPKHDQVFHYSQSRRAPTHITVVRNYQFFQLEVYNSNGTPLTQSQIHDQLRRIRSQSWKTDKEPVGILTSEHRHTWGAAYRRLLKDKINKESVRLIEKGIFTLCLDSPVMRISDDKYSSRMAAQILHGDFPKQVNLSPNSFIQVALQLAYYRVHNEVSASCDSASLRMFRGGRTDVIRSPTNQTLQFVRAVDDPSITREVKLDLLKQAVEAHSMLTDQALRGQAIDRHLLGLKLQAIEERLSVPRLFMDTAYGLATHFRLRTGQVPANTDSVLCFGPQVPDGYAVCYNPQSDHVHFSITAFNCCEETHAETLALTLDSALCQLQELLQPAT